MYERNPAEVHERSVALMRYIARVAESAGISGHVYVVGGAVRNWVLGEPIKDIDIVIDSLGSGVDSESFARALSRAIPVPTSLVTNQYGVAILTVKGPWMLDGHDMQGEVIEIANARAESYAKGAGKGYKPSEVRPATIEEDVYRREFRFNTLLWRMDDLLDGPQQAEILDLTGKGLDDLRAGRICTPSDPDVTFADDPTRMLRAVKFALRYDLEIPDSVASSIRRNAMALQDMPWEPVAALLVNNVLLTEQAIEGLPLLYQLGLLPVLVDMTRGPMRTYLNRQLRDERRAELLMLLLDAGFTLDTPLARLEPEQRERLMENLAAMSDDEGEAYFAAVQRPPVDNRRVIETLRLPPKERAQIGVAARNALLADPELADDPLALTQRVIDTWASYVANRKVVYAAIFLDESSRARLLQWWESDIGPVLPKLYAHHMTIVFKPSDEELAALALDAPAHVRVIGWAADARGQAVAVESSVPSKNPVPHVTVATTPDTSPAYSNELLAAGIVPVRGPVLTGVVGTFP